MRRAVVLMLALGSPVLAGCSDASSGGAGPSVAAAPSQPAPPSAPTGTAFGAVLGGPIGASLSDADRKAAWEAQVAALGSGQRRSWRGSNGVFGLVEPGPDLGGGCRAYSQTVYVGGRPNRDRGVGCKQPDGSWKMTS
jgi:surface antigen